MLWFTYYKGTFSTFVFATQNRAFMLRSVLRTPTGPPGGSRKNLAPKGKTKPLGRIESVFVLLLEKSDVIPGAV
jgi:hypothetical protein